MTLLFLVLLIVMLAGLGLALMWGLKQKRRAIEKEKNVLEVLREGVILCDCRGKVIQLNRTAESILEVTHGRLVGKLFFRAEQEIDAVLFDKCCQVLRQSMATGNSHPISFCIDREKTKCYDVLAKPLEGKAGIALLLCDSISEHRMQQVGRDFIANASHELRTPITIIKGFAETLLDLPEISEAMLEDFTEKIVRNCQRMEHLVKNLLTLADLDYLPISRMQECDLVALIDSCVHTLLAIHSEAQVETWYNCDVITVFGDPDLLELAITNVLENGVKYSPSIPNLKITIEQLPKQVRLSIADCGIGIPTRDLKHVFDRFYTVDKAHSRRMGGAGLGLSIVKTIIKKHHATIAVDSKVGEGTTFTLRF
ncbi:MAG: ATP-binding protein [Chlamydiota bacterium]